MFHDNVTFHCDFIDGFTSTSWPSKCKDLTEGSGPFYEAIYQMLPESIKNYSNEIASEAAFYGEENVKRQERKLSYVKAFALKLLDPNFYPFSTNETYRRGKSEQYRLSALYRCNRFEWNQT